MRSEPRSGSGTSSAHSPSSVSTTRWPRHSSSARTVDFPAPDMPVTNTIVMGRTSGRWRPREPCRFVVRDVGVRLGGRSGRGRDARVIPRGGGVNREPLALAPVLRAAAHHHDGARAVAGPDEHVSRERRAVEVVARGEPAFLALHDQQARPREHEEPLLRVLAVVARVELPRFEHAHVDAELAEAVVGRLGGAGDAHPRVAPGDDVREVDDEPALAGGSEPVGCLFDRGLWHLGSVPRPVWSPPMTDPRTAPFGAVHLADVDVATDVCPDYPDATDSEFYLVRRHFDIRAFGVNGITGDAGDELVDPHHERDVEA